LGLSLPAQGGREIAVFVAYSVGFSQSAGECLIVLLQFGQHVQWLHISGVVIRDPLFASNVSDGTQGCATDFAHPLRHGIGHG